MSAPARLRSWLQDAAWPYWLANGIDTEHGGFHESLPCTADFRRLRVVARQIYVFAQAHAAGIPGADAAVALGVAFLGRHAALPGGGYAWRFALDNRVIDDTRDFYDHAFVLLAFASAASVLPAAPLRIKALAVLDFLDRAMAHQAGGYRESLPDHPGGHRRQNPHMHLLEALLAAHEAFGDPVFLIRASEMIDLFLTRMLDSHLGALPEFYDADWRPIRRDGAYLVEPGHHCEWVWLLDWYARVTCPDMRLTEAAAALMRFVDRAGHAPHGGLVGVVTSHEQIHEGGTRLWAQCERLKAEFIRPDGTLQGQHDAASVLAGFLQPDGTWHERRDASGQFIEAPAPATSLYHLTSAILVADRVLTHPAMPHTSPE
jgi:mannose-6-phosphate isomerase